MTTPFDLEKAKAGAPVKTRSGTPVRIVCFDAAGPQPIVALHSEDDMDMPDFGHEEAWRHYSDGTFAKNKSHSGLDLVMA